MPETGSNRYIVPESAIAPVFAALRSAGVPNHHFPALRELVQCWLEAAQVSFRPEFLEMSEQPLLLSEYTSAIDSVMASHFDLVRERIFSARAETDGRSLGDVLADVEIIGRLVDAQQRSLSAKATA